LVELLLDNNANLSIQDNNKNTPLHVACKMNEIEIAKMILSQKVCVNIKGNNINLEYFL